MKVWEALVQSQVRFNKVPEKVPEKKQEALVQVQVKFNGFRRRFWRRPGRLWRRVRFNEVPEKVVPEKLGGFGAKPGQVQQVSGEGSRRRFQEALVQSQVRFNRVLEKVPEKVPAKVWEALV